jgi:cell division transport system permease protein
MSLPDSSLMDADLPEDLSEAPPARLKPIDRIKAAALGRQQSGGAGLIPAASIAGRSLVMVIAIMTFLASITAGTVWLIAGASQDWTAAISREATIQVKPRTGRNIEADLTEAAAIARRSAAIGTVTIMPEADSRALLSPWLGDALKASDLPVPRLIELSLSGSGDLAALRKDLAATLPTATLDDHRPWLDRLSRMANTLVAIGLIILALVMAATALAVAFATRGAMSGNREIISVLSLVGAEDRFIAREFQGHFLRLGLEGGIIGGIAAIAVFFIGGGLSGSWLGSAGNDQVEALFGSFSLGWLGHLFIVIIVALVAALAAYVSRLTVFQNLRLKL